MSNSKFTDAQLKRLADQGIGNNEMARQLGVSKGAVSQRMKALRQNLAKYAVLHRAGEIMKKDLNAADQLKKLNDKANALLDMLSAAIEGNEEAKAKIDPKGIKPLEELSLKAIREIRGQMRLLVDIMRNLYDHEQAAIFQQEVLEVIHSVEPELRNRIVAKLKERRAMGTLTAFPG